MLSQFQGSVSMHRDRLALRFLIIACTSVFLPGSARAEQADTSATIEKDQQLYLVNADGTWSMTRDMSFLLNSVAAVKELGQRPFSYNATLETLEVIEAYTEKPDGRKVPVLPESIREQQDQGSSDLNMFEDVRTKVVIFPHVEVGDRLVMQVRQRQVKALIPGQFQDLSLPLPYQARQGRLIYDLPELMTLHADARGYIGTLIPAAPGRKRYQYDYVEHDRPGPQPGAVSEFDYGDRLAVSTMANPAGLAAAYQQGSAGTARVTPAISALQRSITRGVVGQRAQALALGDWVRKHIRYVAVLIGNGGLVPHKADEILEYGYGDCKDHATLLEALLTSAGIDSTQALINSGNAFSLPVVGALGTLNHVISYVPSLDLYIDSTAINVSAGYLPQGDLDKPVVLTRTGTLARTPARQKSQVAIEVELVYDAAGQSVANRTRTAQGAAAEEQRHGIRNRETPVEGESFDAGALASSTDEFVTRDTIRNRWRLTEQKKLKVMHDSGEILKLVTFRDFLGLALLRTRDFPCPAHDVQYRTRIRVPPGFRLAALPPPLALHTPSFDYVSEFVREQDAIVAYRRYHVHPARAFCTSEDAAAMAALEPQIQADLFGSLIFDPQ